MTLLDALTPRWAEISALLDEALALPADEREAWLESLIGARAELKDSLHRLLDAQASVETGSFLNTLPKLDVDAGGPVFTEAAAGTLVGPYRLVSELGRGGMGAVWLAERADGQLKRRVALKLPHLAWSQALGERLARERDFLASLEHPHIARLYDAGVDRQGRPYLAMEYVEGEPIDVYCRAHAVPLRGRITLLLQVCDAVAHAHSRLVVHRDLKPGNILVTPDGQVRLLDFGIAKLMEGDRTEETALTQMSGRALTLDYASPEQIRGEPLGTASDVYSLGVVAYELLAGQRPYRLKRGSAAELEEAIANADPPRASEVAADPLLKKQLRGDLDAILNKALKKDPAQRYPTTVAFAADIERHLQGHAVQARPDGRLYVARKFISRHRLSVGAASAVLLALSGGLGAALWQKYAAEQNLREAQLALEREAGVRTLYIETLATVAGWDAATFAQPSSVSRMLKRKADELEVRYKDMPHQRLSILNVVGTQLTWMGDYEGSLDALRRYVALLQQMPFDARSLLEGQVKTARLLSMLDRREEAVVVLRETLARVPHGNRVAGTYAWVESELAFNLGVLGKRQEAIALLDEAARKLATSEDAKHKIRWEIPRNQARLQLGYDDPEAVRLMQRSRDGALTDSDNTQADLGAIFGSLGMALAAVGRLDEATTALREAQWRFEQAFGKVDRDSVMVLGRLAQIASAQGRHDDARRMLAERRAEVEQRPGSDTPVALRTLRAHQIDAEVQRGDLDAAARFVTSEALPAAALPTDREAIAYVAGEARWLAWSDRAALAEQRVAAWLRALKPHEADGPLGFRARISLAEARLASGSQRAALDDLEPLLATMRQAGATRTWAYGHAHEVAAVAMAGVGEASRALELLQQFDRDVGREARVPSSRTERADSAARRCEVLLAAGRKADAAALLRTMDENLAGQHPASPRFAAQRRLAAALAGGPQAPS